MSNGMRGPGQAVAPVDQSGQELMEVTFRQLVLATGGAYLVWHVVAAVHWPAVADWRHWCVSMLMFTLCGFALWGRSRNRQWVQFGWLLGVGATATLALSLFRRPEIVLMLALLPLMGAMIRGRWGALGALAATAGLLILVSGLRPFVPLPLAYATGAAAAFGGLLGVVYTQALTTVTQWSLYNFQRAQEQTEEARQHRGQLVHLLKQLHQAYYQLGRANAMLAAAHASAEAAERFKAEFVTNISHELRTPLNLILGFTEVMVMSPESYGNVPLPGPYRGDLNAVYHSAQHLLALVDDVLDLARIEVGKLALLREMVEIDGLIAEVSEMLHDYIVAKGLTLKLKIDNALPPLWIDRLRIRQTLLNLLVNAIRHTERGHIEVVACSQGEVVLIQVSDTGRGIPPAEQSRMFQEFHATEQPATAWHSGAGLGLPISKKFVELHQGQMGFDSSYDQGARFWFTLPLANASNGAPASQVLTQQRPDVHIRPSERVVIVVHSDAAIAALFKRYLTSCRVIAAPDADAGAQLLQTHQAVALITDATTPLACPKPPTLILRVPLPDNQLAVSALGVTDLLVKPVARAELLRAIDRLPQPVARVLVVDDNPEVVRMFRRMLHTRISPQQCLEAYNGEEALNLMRSHAPDLVLLDLIMPVVDGKSVLARMAAEPALAAIPVILVSARGQDAIQSPLSGAIQIEKAQGFELGELVHTVENVIHALTPGWSQLGGDGPTPATTPVASLA